MFVWSELKEGLRFSSNSAFCTFFFLFFLKKILAWIGGFGRFRPESAWFSANRLESEPRRRESAIKKKKKPRGMTRWDARAASSLAHRHVRRGCGTSGAASVLHRLYLTCRLFIGCYIVIHSLYFGGRSLGC